jgi:hypothetical protein
MIERNWQVFSSLTRRSTLAHSAVVLDTILCRDVVETVDMKKLEMPSALISTKDGGDEWHASLRCMLGCWGSLTEERDSRNWRLRHGALLMRKTFVTITARLNCQSGIQTALDPH